jgi:hypothetical protein
VPFNRTHDLLLIAFAAGIWASARGRRALHVVAALLFGNAVVGLMGTAFAPMHMRGVEATLTDTMHIVLTSVIVVFTLLATGFGATAFGRRFRWYSIGTIGLLLVFGAVAGLQGSKLAAQEPTPWMGVFERINVYGYLLWMGILAITLLRDPKSWDRQDSEGRWPS